MCIVHSIKSVWTEDDSFWQDSAGYIIRLDRQELLADSPYILPVWTAFDRILQLYYPFRRTVTVNGILQALLDNQ